MGYTAPWYVMGDVDDPTVGVAGRLSCYLRTSDGIFLTYRTTARGDEARVRLTTSSGFVNRRRGGRS